LNESVVAGDLKKYRQNQSAGLRILN